MTRFLSVFAAILISALASSTAVLADVEFVDNASWRDAAEAAGYSVHPYIGGVTITTYTTTIEIVGNGLPYIIYDPVIESHHQIGLSSVTGSFFFGSECDTSPGCMITDLSELHIVFDAPIHGMQFNSLSQVSALAISPPGDQFYTDGNFAQMFSLFGDSFSELAFYSSFTDSPNALDLEDILVATAPEPASLALVLAALPFVVKRTSRKGLLARN